MTGRVVITNYDPRTLSDAERQVLNTRAGANPGNFVFVDIRPGHPGGDLPLFGALKLRSLNRILSFVAAAYGGSGEYDVPKDPRTGDSGPNPRRALGIEVTAQAPPGVLPHARYCVPKDCRVLSVTGRGSVPTFTCGFSHIPENSYRTIRRA